MWLPKAQRPESAFLFRIPMNHSLFVYWLELVLSSLLYPNSLSDLERVSILQLQLFCQTLYGRDLYNLVVLNLCFGCPQISILSPIPFLVHIELKFKIFNPHRHT